MTTGRVAIVTGSSRGIGRAIAIQLAKDGHHVVINYQSNASKAQDVVDEIHATTKAKAIAVQGDVGILTDGEKLIQATLSAFGRIDIVVFNAAWIVSQTIHQVTEESYEEAFRTNVKAPLFFTKQLIPHLKSGSRLIYISTSLTSISTIQPNYFLYVATKGAVEQMVRALSKDLGSKGITVNCINPGATDTDGFREGKTEQQIQFAAAAHPQGRLGQPDEIANVVSFIAGDSSAWVNGQILRVNGGRAV
ncbi:hypothetical protein BGZ94_003073 [Podila epigama]|nr:hypothetical protein BGZ94_003073 [Podila epigama]